MLIYYIEVTNPNNVSLFPPSLTTYKAMVTEASTGVITLLQNDRGSVIHLFANTSELTTYINLIALSGDDLAAMNEWKTANNIIINYRIFELTTSADTPSVLG